MLYPVLIQERPDGKYEASVLIIPGISGVGATREDALQGVKQAISDAVSREELVFVDIQSTPQAEPMNNDSAANDPLIGLFDLGTADLAREAEHILQDAIKSRSGWTTKE